MCVHVCSVMSDCDSTDCSLPGSSVHGIFQARILEWVAIPFSRTYGQHSTTEKVVGLPSQSDFTFESWFQHLQAVKPQASCLNSLSPCFLI